MSLLAAVVACEEPKEIGLTPTTPVGVLYTDTLTITRTTFQFDSVRSQQQSSLLIGRYTDPQFGQIEARAYMQLGLNGPFAVTDSGTTNVTAANRILLDSTKLRLPLNDIWYGDTTVRQELVLSRLTDSLRTTNYDISTVGPPVGQVVARRTVLPSPKVGDSLAYQKSLFIDASIGQELLNLANTDAVQLSPTVAPVDPLGFRKRIARDFVLTSNSPANAAVVGLNTLPTNTNATYCTLTVYYHVQGEKNYPRFYTFTFTGRRFNQIISKRTGVLASLKPGQSLPNTTTARTYVQPATGITTKLQFPGLTNLIKSGRIAINRADLVITPTPTEDARLPLPPYVVLSEVNAQNHLTRTDITSGGVYLFTVQQSQGIGVGPLNRLASSFVSPQTVFLDTRTNSYTCQLGGYLQSVVAGISPNDGLAILTPSSSLFPTTQSGTIDATQAVATDRVWRMTLDGKASVKLVVFYTTSN